MILQAAKDHAIDPQISWMIGDILNDVEAGNRAGCNTIHFNNGNETEWLKGDYRQPLHTVQDLVQGSGDIVCHSPVYEVQLEAVALLQNRRFANVIFPSL